MPTTPIRDLFDRYAPDTLVPWKSFVLNIELCERVRGVPGAVVECGVWRGGMIAALAEWLGFERDYWLCDSFEGLPPADLDLDGQRAVDWWESGKRNHCAEAEATARATMDRTGIPPERLHVLAGWFADTLPGARLGPVALLRLDCDWFASTADVLNALWGAVVPGGLIVIDDYYTWPGCGRAVRCFLRVNGLGPVQPFRDANGHKIPYLVKGEAGPVVPITAADHRVELDG